MIVHLCSFFEAQGRCKVDGVWWQWEFHHYLGPTFVDKKGEQIAFPPEKHPVWSRFDVWLRRWQSRQRVTKECC